MSSLPPAQIESRDEQSLRLVLDLTPDMAVFAGHFPQRAVLPGVAQIDWAMGFAAAELGLSQRAARTFQVKFRRVIQPPARAELDLRLDRARQRLRFVYRLGGEISSQGSIVLDAP